MNSGVEEGVEEKAFGDVDSFGGTGCVVVLLLGVYFFGWWEGGSFEDCDAVGAVLNGDELELFGVSIFIRCRKGVCRSAYLNKIQGLRCSQG